MNQTRSFFFGIPLVWCRGTDTAVPYRTGGRYSAGADTGASGSEPLDGLSGGRGDAVLGASRQGHAAEPGPEGGAELLLLLKGLETVGEQGEGSRVAENFLAASATMNKGLAMERGRMAVCLCLVIVGIAMIMLAAAAVWPGGMAWGARVGFGAAGAALATVEFKILCLFVRLRDRIAVDHQNLVNTALAAKIKYDELIVRERALVLNIFAAARYPQQAGDIADFTGRIYGSRLE